MSTPFNPKRNTPRPLTDVMDGLDVLAKKKIDLIKQELTNLAGDLAHALQNKEEQERKLSRHEKQLASLENEQKQVRTKVLKLCADLAMLQVGIDDSEAETKTHRSFEKRHAAAMLDLDNVLSCRDDISTQVDLARNEIKASYAEIENCQNVMINIKEEMLLNAQKLSQN